MGTFFRQLVPALALLSAAVPAASAPAPVVHTASGPVAGLVRSSDHAWLGIPFAAPPVGELRWKPPQPHAPWRAPRAAQSFGTSCAQYETMDRFAAPSAAEDCLTLNVYAPAGPVKKGAPVLVWLFGGGLSAGSANDYDPASLVRQGAVVVTVNYRLGMLGFFANPALGADNASSNYGILDQIAALKWVRRNIAGFGGDPRKVTIFGESAGARSVATLIASPLAKGLFSGAILESLNYEATKSSLTDAQDLGRRFARQAGCEETGIACLRGLTTAQVLDAQRKTPPGPSFGGAVGGPDIPETLQSALRHGRFNRVPLIIGWNHDEFTWRNAINEVERGTRATRADYLVLARRLGRRDPAHADADAAAIISAYPLAGQDTPALVMARMQTDSYFVCGTRRFLRDLAGQAPAWAYEFDVPNSPQSNRPASFPVGSAHTTEIQYLFEGFHGATGTVNALSPRQLRLARQMQRMWIALARSGKPDSAARTPRWPQAAATGTPVLRLATSGPPLHPAPYADRNCDLWDRIAGD